MSGKTFTSDEAAAVIEHVQGLDKISALRDLAGELDLSKEGGKADLAERITAFVREHTTGAAAETQPQEQPTTPPAATAVHDREPGDEVPITRVHKYTGAWWCPVCDTSHLPAIPRCAGCGAVREDDVVIVVP